ncbi:MAG: aldo/keto reductase [Treponema sp.]|nr:aldo/keto reductase [Treponema sp.]
MIYKQFKDKKLSYLGLGCMRLPTTAPRGPIDEPKARAIIEYAYENGVNYFDTAYRYLSGQSEPFSASVLKQYPRDTWNLATKMPGHQLEYKDGKISVTGYLTGETLHSLEQIFEDQLKRCQVDYFDFYLLHNVSDRSYDLYTDAQLGCIEFLLAQKKAGHIKHLGFSAHCGAETMEKFLSHSKQFYGDCFEFVQFQLNYMDWILYGADKTYDVVTKHGLDIIAMEPVRGGRLASLNDEANALLKKERPNDSIASWAFRFLQTLPNMTVALSGMTTMEQIVENVALFQKEEPATEKEKELLRNIIEGTLDLVPCTSCEYCMEVCPQGLNIPRLLSFCNDIRLANPPLARIDSLEDKEKHSACVACGLCSPQCPQGIDIPAAMKRFQEDYTKAKAKAGA